MAFDFQKTMADIRDLKTAIQAGQPAEILITGGYVVTDAGELVKTFGGSSLVGASGEQFSEEEKEEICEQIQEVKTAFANNNKNVKFDHNQTGKFGDGTILNIFLQNLPQILEIFSRFFGK